MTSEAPPVPAAKPNPARRIGGVIASPSETLREIAERPDWLVPLLIIVFASLLLGFTMSSKVDFETATREQLERRGVTGPELENQLEMISKVQRLTTPVFTALGGIIVPLVVALALMLAGRIFGGEATFKQSFAVACYAWIPQALKTLIMSALLFRAGQLDVMQLPLLLKSNLGFLADPRTSPGVFTLLASLDLFAIWTIILLGIGFAYAHRLTPSVATALAVALFVIVVLCQAGITAAFGGSS
jgi:membrane protein, antimicrobial resistance system